MSSDLISIMFPEYVQSMHPVPEEFDAVFFENLEELFS